jgi:hypothetical protein
MPAAVRITRAGLDAAGLQDAAPRSRDAAASRSHSPELNRVDNVRAFPRPNKLSNRVCRDGDDMLDARAGACDRLAAQPERITAIA